VLNEKPVRMADKEKLYKFFVREKLEDKLKHDETLYLKALKEKECHEIEVLNKQKQKFNQVNNNNAIQNYK
jgi:hypothetical protein